MSYTFSGTLSESVSSFARLLIDGLMSVFENGSSAETWRRSPSRSMVVTQRVRASFTKAIVCHGAHGDDTLTWVMVVPNCAPMADASTCLNSGEWIQQSSARTVRSECVASLYYGALSYFVQPLSLCALNAAW